MAPTTAESRAAVRVMRLSWRMRTERPGGNERLTLVPGRIRGMGLQVCLQSVALRKAFTNGSAGGHSSTPTEEFLNCEIVEFARLRRGRPA